MACLRDFRDSQQPLNWCRSEGKEIKMTPTMAAPASEMTTPSNRRLPERISSSRLRSPSFNIGVLISVD
jgi:hypothetical protein